MPNRLKSIREQRGLTQEALADKVHVTHSAIQRIESGKRQLTEAMVVKLAAVLKVHPGELFAPLFTDSNQDQAAQIAATMPPEDRAHWLATGFRLAGMRPPAPPDEKRGTGN